jgi:DNA-binding MarR family transcriptional regulator
VSSWPISSATATSSASQTRPDRRAKLVRATPRGREVYAIARDVMADVTARGTERLGAQRMRELRALLEELTAAP